MSKMLYALMDSTDHVMEDGTPQELNGLVRSWPRQDCAHTLVVNQTWRWLATAKLYSEKELTSRVLSQN